MVCGHCRCSAYPHISSLLLSQLLWAQRPPATFFWGLPLSYRIIITHFSAVEGPVNWHPQWLTWAGVYRPSCSLAQDATDSKMSFTLQISPQIRLNLVWNRALSGCVPFPVLFPHSLAVSFAWEHFPNKSRTQESLSQDPTLGEGNKDIDIHTQFLPSSSSPADQRGWQSPNWKRFYSPGFLLGKVLYLFGRMS